VPGVPIGVGAREKGAGAFAEVGAARVVADRPRTGRGERVEDSVSSVGRDERHELVLRLGRPRVEWLDVLDADGLREGVADTGVGDVGVGVRDVEGDTVADQPMDEPALGARRRNRCGAAEVERMMRDEQPGARSDRLVSRRDDRVDGEVHLVDRCIRIAADQPDRVPRLSPPRVIVLLERRDDVADRRHVGDPS
jgi:hypothetical protein